MSVYMLVWVGCGRCVEVRHLSGVSSVFLLCGPQDQTQVIRVGYRHLLPLKHLASGEYFNV